MLLLQQIVFAKQRFFFRYFEILNSKRINNRYYKFMLILFENICIVDFNTITLKKKNYVIVLT